MKNETIIIGGGASALMAAALLPKNSATIIEHNANPGAKMLISGGGRCNITNEVMGAEYFLGDEAFVAPALQAFDQHALITWLKKRGLKIEIRKGSQYFCQHSAKDIVVLLRREAEKQKIRLNEEVRSVSKHGTHFTVVTNRGSYSARRVIVASGGLSFPRLGASDIGYRIATHFGHSITRTAPALVGFTVQKEQFFFKELSGASTDVCITVGDQRCSGALLFAHKGISGPAVLDASLYWEKGTIEIDFLPDFSLKGLRGSKKNISTLLPLSKRITKAFLLQLGLEDKPFAKLSSDEMGRLESLHHYRFAPAGTFGFSKAEVTKGGVDTDEVDRQTMMSKKIPGLYFVGEVLDVTGRLGGYNFQWAFSSAFVCAEQLKGKR